MDGLSAAYFVLFVAGSGFSIVSWLLGARGHHGHSHGAHALHGALAPHGAPAAHALAAHGGHAHAAPHHGRLGRARFPFADLTAWSALACVGGGVGTLLRAAGWSAIPSLLGAVPSGLAAAYGVGALMGWLERGTRFAEPLPSGVVATVLTRIGAGQTGEVVYTQRGARHTLPAVSASGREIAAGAEVIFLEVQDGVARVAPSEEVFEEKEKN